MARSTSSRKKKKIGRWIVLAVVVVFLYFSFTGPSGIISVYRARRQVIDARARHDSLQQDIDSMQTRLRRLKNDTAFIEKTAREKLGMAKKGEYIFKFPDSNERNEGHEKRH